MTTSIRALIAIAAGVLSLSACQTPQAPAEERQVPVDGNNVADVQAAGYRVVNEDGKKLYCRKDPKTGSHVRKQTTCLTEQELAQLIEYTRQQQEQMRSRVPRQGR